jgi:regulator of protease activity HflC (stomatin/prohibitin superfamily)
MNLSSILGFVSLAGWLMVLGGAAIAISNSTQHRSARPGILLSLVGVIVGILFFIASTGLLTIGATEVAVVFQSVGGNPATNNLWPQPLKSGVHIIAPIVNEPYIYSTEIHNYTMSKTANEGAVGGDDSVAVRTKDGQQVYIDIGVQYRVNPDKANQVHLKYRQRFEEDFVRPIVRAAVRDVISGYIVQDLLGEKRAEIQKGIFDSVVGKFDESGLELRDLLVRNITFSEEFIKAVENKQVAEQQAEQAKQEAERARTLAKGKADAAVTEAQGEADSNVARAKGEAQSIELKAAADAKALALISEQLQKNPQLIQWRYIETLADDIRMILLPSNSPFLFDPNALANGQLGGNSSSTTAEAAPTTTP